VVRQKRRLKNASGKERVPAASLTPPRYDCSNPAINSILARRYQNSAFDGNISAYRKLHPPQNMHTDKTTCSRVGSFFTAADQFVLVRKRREWQRDAALLSYTMV
jgi:hypothetical protein